MNSQKRTSLGLEDDQIDLEELTGIGQERPQLSEKQQKALIKAGEKTGFVSRKPTVRRRISPYSAQFGGKCREGIKPLFREIASRLDIYENQAIELAILALIEKEGFEDLKAQYMELVK
ncbi:hypothetical protein [Desulfosarcina ovata]|uniref:hypothetical protein n=1 Tax=Desulfosarcina ovata TaxID=83564 RepID=UPI0012D30456|nr:hypothetical protein [Desulfosarcina ovata]